MKVCSQDLLRRCSRQLSFLVNDFRCFWDFFVQMIHGHFAIGGEFVTAKMISCRGAGTKFMHNERKGIGNPHVTKSDGI